MPEAEKLEPFIPPPKGRKKHKRGKGRPRIKRRGRPDPVTKMDGDIGFRIDDKEYHTKIRDQNKLTEEVLAGVDSAAGMQEVAAHALDLFGGPAGFAKALTTEYLRTKKGSAARARALDMVARVINRASQLAENADVGAVTDDDLAREIQKQMKRMGIGQLDYVLVESGGGI